MNMSKTTSWAGVGFVVTLCLAALFLLPWDNDSNNGPSGFAQSDGTVPAVPDEPEIDPEDTDGDGLKDEYEMLFAHSLSTSGDEDKDGLPDTLEEHYFSFTHVTGDEDKDGLPDRWEVKHFGHLNYGPEDNPDSDEWNNITELIRGHGYDPDEYTVITETTGDRRNGPDHKQYYRHQYEEALRQGKFDIPWDEL